MSNGNGYGYGNRETDPPFYDKPEFYGFLLAVGIIVGFVLLVKNDYDYERDHPHVSFKFDVDFLEVTSMPNMTSNQPDEAQLRLNLTVTTQLHAEYFSTLQVSVEYDHQFVSNTTIAHFHQDPLSDKTIPVHMGTASDSISKKLPSEGVLEFTVIVHGDYREVDHRCGIGFSCDMKMVCEGVRVTVSSTNNTWNGSTKVVHSLANTAPPAVTLPSNPRNILAMFGKQQKQIHDSGSR